MIAAESDFVRITRTRSLVGVGALEYAEFERNDLIGRESGKAVFSGLHTHRLLAQRSDRKRAGSYRGFKQRETRCFIRKVRCFIMVIELYLPNLF